MDRASGVWTVRGVGLEARKLAKSEAAKAGVTLGQWIERAIENGAYPVYQVGANGEVSQVGKKTPTIREVVDGKVLELGPVVDCEVEDEPAFVESVVVAPKARKPRVVCEHGVEKGYNCWQCGGLAVIR